MHRSLRTDEWQHHQGAQVRRKLIYGLALTGALLLVYWANLASTPRAAHMIRIVDAKSWVSPFGYTWISSKEVAYVRFGANGQFEVAITDVQSNSIRVVGKIDATTTLSMQKPMTWVRLSPHAKHTLLVLP